MIKIGVVVATQGPVALLGTSFLKAVQLAKEDLPPTQHRYDLVVEEIAGPDKAEPAIQKLIESDKVDGLIVGLSMSGQIAKKHATAARIPLFCICSVSSVGDELFTFTIMPLAEDEALQWVAEAKRRGIRIEAAIATAPDVYFVEAFNPAMDILGQHLQEAKIRNLASVVSFSLSERPELFEGGWYTDSYVSPEFKGRLEQRYPGTRLATHMMPYAYDSFRIMVEGFESERGVLAHVRGLTEYQGTAGTITKQAGTGNFRSSPAVWVIKNGKPTLLSHA